MNDFNWGITLGRFFVSIIINEYFCGVAIRIGKEFATTYGNNFVYHIRIQIGYGQFTIGIISKEKQRKIRNDHNKHTNTL